MKRRQFLAVSGIALFAGCSEDESGAGELSEALAEQDEKNAADTTPEQTATSTRQPTTSRPPSAQIIDTKLITGASAFGEVPFSVVEVENPGSTHHGTARVQARFYDGNGALIGTRTPSVDIIPPETTWRTYSRYASDDRDEIERVEADISEVYPQHQIQAPEGATVTESEMVADPSTGVTVTGEVEVSGSGIGSLDLYALLYDGEGRYLGAATDSQQDLRSGEAWRFSASAFARVPQDWPQIEEYQMLLDGS